MKIKLHKNFEKHYKKLTEREKKKFKQRRDIFLKDEFNPILNNHSVKGKYKGYRSINITGELRAIFKRTKEMIIFVEIGSYSQLYG